MDIRDTSLDDMRPFYETLAQALKPFRSAYDLRGANVAGCLVERGNGRLRGQRRFSFLDKRHQAVSITIDLVEMARNPREYIDQLLHFVDKAMAQAKKDMPTLIMPGALGLAT